MKILFAGGGTLGPVTPLLAVASALRRIEPSVELAWVGTPHGPERALVEKAGIPFEAIAAVKLSRYPSLSWFALPFRWMTARRHAEAMIDRLQPDAVVSVGGYTAVPVILAAARRGIPCFTHQLDQRPGLSNKKIAPLCASVTTSFPYRTRPFGERVADQRIATPVRFLPGDMPDRSAAVRAFGFDPEKHVVLIFGGGTGAQALNMLVESTIPVWLSFAQVIHVTGIGKGNPEPSAARGYVRREFLDREMKDAYAAADLIISRAGMGTISEVASLSKAAILVPIPGSHQEDNARAVEQGGAAMVLRQKDDHFEKDIILAAQTLLTDRDARTQLGRRAHDFFPTDDGTAFAQRIVDILAAEKN